jgi:class 3 adenylate cyclase/CHASE2 domain-containing sensor protein
LNARFKLKLKRDVPILIAGGVIALVCLFQILPRFYPQFDLFQRLEWMSYDWRARIAARSLPPCAANLAGVFIDDTAVKAINDGSFGYQFSWPWPRSFHGRLVRELSAQGARAVAFDILLDQVQPPEARTMVNVPGQGPLSSDEFFAREIRRAGNVVLSAESGGLFPAELFLTNAWAVGGISAKLDSDGILRRVKAFDERRVWQSEISRRVRALNLKLDKAVFESGRMIIPRSDGEEPYEMPLDVNGRLKLDEITGNSKTPPPEPPYTFERIWHMGIVLAARELKLDLNKAVVEPNRIILRGEGGVERIIPVDAEGFFYIDWTLHWQDPRFYAENVIPLIRQDESRDTGRTNLASRFSGKLVVVGSIGTGNNISDRGATPLGKETMLVSEHWNVANSVIMNRFIRKSSNAMELMLVVLLGATAASLTWKLRTLRASFWIVMVLVSYTALGIFLFVQYRYWLPFALPLLGALLTTHVCMVTYRARAEHTARQHIKSVFSKIVSPNVVNELLKTEKMSLGGARRIVTVYFADIRGFTRVTDEYQVQAEEYIRTHKLPKAVADAYLDEQARDVLGTVSLYLSMIADTIKKHNGTLDKYIGDCVMAFWGAPTPNDRHAVDCVRAAIDAQRAIYALNLRRAAENKQREHENEIRVASGQAPLPMLTLLALGSGISTGLVTVGLMGSDEHGMNYTVFGREVNLASRLEGVSGRGRIIISDTTYQQIKRLDSELAATCVELPPVTVKGIRDTVQVYEVQWREIDTEMQAYDTAILTGKQTAAAADMIPSDEG